MSRIEFIVKAIDKELILKGKNYLTLGQANKWLYENGHITESEKQTGFLKKLLEEGSIKNAKQTETSPKQWRLFLSDKKLRPLETVRTKTIIDEYEKEVDFDPKDKFVPKYINLKNQDKSNTDSIPWKWIIIGIIVIILIYSQFSNNDNSTTSEYNITNETYAATSKENFDEMFMYIADNDKYAINLMILNGQVRILQKGLKVRLVDNHFAYSVIREHGSTQKYWVVTEHIGK